MQFGTSHPAGEAEFVLGATVQHFQLLSGGAIFRTVRQRLWLNCEVLDGVSLDGRFRTSARVVDVVILDDQGV